MYIYKGKIYHTKYEIKQEHNLTSCKVAAKIRDKEIIRVINNHTGTHTYETIHNHTECNSQ